MRDGSLRAESAGTRRLCRATDVIGTRRGRPACGQAWDPPDCLNGQRNAVSPFCYRGSSLAQERSGGGRGRQSGAHEPNYRPPTTIIPNSFKVFLLEKPFSFLLDGFFSFSLSLTHHATHS